MFGKLKKRIEKLEAEVAIDAALQAQAEERSAKELAALIAEAIRPLKTDLSSLIAHVDRHDKDLDCLAELRGQVGVLLANLQPPTFSPSDAQIKQLTSIIARIESQVSRHQNELQKLLLIPQLVEVPAVPEKVTVIPAVPARYELKSKR